MKKRGKSPEEGASWMDTYGDMVTLLLCFFVLLYSISQVDQNKWVQVVKSFNPDAEYVGNGGGSGEGGSEDVSAEDFDSLYAQLQEAVENAQLQSDVELYKGDGYTFITFRDRVFFDGDSSVIKQEGTAILDQLSQILSGVSESVAEIQILGHTSQAEPGVPNDPESDRILSAERSARVAAYIQVRTTVSADKIVSVGYGQHRPIASFDTPEDRARNRRVEILITRTDAVIQTLDEYYEQMGR